MGIIESFFVKPEIQAIQSKKLKKYSCTKKYSEQQVAEMLNQASKIGFYMANFPSIGFNKNGHTYVVERVFREYKK